MLSPGGRPGYNGSPLSQSRTSNWVAKRGGLPPYVRAVVRALARKHGGKPTRADYAIAVSRMKKWKHSKHPAVAAAASAADAQWTAMKASK